MFWEHNSQFPATVVYPKEVNLKSLLFPYDVPDYLSEQEVLIIQIDKEAKTIPEDISTERIASRFASLKSIKEIKEFAETYGLLGVEGDINQFHVWSSPAYSNLHRYEYLIKWIENIDVVRKLMYLYRAIKNDKEEFEEGFLRQFISNFNYFKFDDDHLIQNEITKLNKLAESTHPALLNWTLYKEIYPNENDKEIATRVLLDLISDKLRGGVHITNRPLKKVPGVTGFTIQETKYTDTLLATIYLDIWNMVLDNRSVEICEHCGLPLEKTKRGKYCRNACKQAEYRNRKKVLSLYKKGKTLQEIKSITDFDHHKIENYIADHQERTG